MDKIYKIHEYFYRDWISQNSTKQYRYTSIRSATIIILSLLSQRITHSHHDYAKLGYDSWVTYIHQVSGCVCLDNDSFSTAGVHLVRNGAS